MNFRNASPTRNEERGFAEMNFRNASLRETRNEVRRDELQRKEMSLEKCDKTEQDKARRLKACSCTSKEEQRRVAKRFIAFFQNEERPSC